MKGSGMKMAISTSFKNSLLGGVISMVCAFGVGAQPAVSKAVEKSVSQAAKSQASEPVEVQLVRRKVVLIDAKETLQDAGTAKPGEILEETAIYTNKSKSFVTKLEATLPIPLNTELVPNSIKPATAAVRASTDGLSFRPLPLKRKVKLANGVETEQLVPLNEYRFLRWYPGELAAGKSLNYSARFKIVDDKPTAVQAR